MSAYMRRLDQQCLRCGLRQATWEVFNARNALIGRYCKMCAEAVLRAIDIADRMATKEAAKSA
jgi:hypothetical protein